MSQSYTDPPTYYLPSPLRQCRGHCHSLEYLDPNISPATFTACWKACDARYDGHTFYVADQPTSYMKHIKNTFTGMKADSICEIIIFAAVIFFCYLACFKSHKLNLGQGFHATIQALSKVFLALLLPITGLANMLFALKQHIVDINQSRGAAQFHYEDGYRAGTLAAEEDAAKKEEANDNHHRNEMAKAKEEHLAKLRAQRRLLEPANIRREIDGLKHQCQLYESKIDILDSSNKELREKNSYLKGKHAAREITKLKCDNDYLQEQRVNLIDKLQHEQDDHQATREEVQELKFEKGERIFQVARAERFGLKADPIAIELQLQVKSLTADLDTANTRLSSERQRQHEQSTQKESEHQGTLKYLNDTIARLVRERDAAASSVTQEANFTMRTQSLRIQELEGQILAMQRADEAFRVQVSANFTACEQKIHADWNAWRATMEQNVEQHITKLENDHADAKRQLERDVNLRQDEILRLNAELKKRQIDLGPKQGNTGGPKLVFGGLKDPMKKIRELEKLIKEHEATILERDGQISAQKVLLDEVEDSCIVEGEDPVEDEAETQDPGKLRKQILDLEGELEDLKREKRQDDYEKSQKDDGDMAELRRTHDKIMREGRKSQDMAEKWQREALKLKRENLALKGQSSTAA